MLLGAEHFFKILKNQRFELGRGLPTLQLTSFGWVIGGQVEMIEPTHSITMCSCTVDEQLQRFWEIEELTQDKALSPSEQICEQNFQSTTHRDSFGRFVVSLPKQNFFSKLGDSERIALCRFYNLEKRLAKNAKLKEESTAFMHEYFALGHMKPIDNQDLKDMKTFYLPHHCVVNYHSSTTKLRVVFDASVKSTSGLSLNETLLVGPTLQADLFTQILKFRQHKFVVTADIVKMYRQISVSEEDKYLQIIFWRDDPDQPLQKFALTTVTYGTAPASYLAIKCLRQLAVEAEYIYPEAATSILEDFYVDDYIRGDDDEKRLMKIQEQVDDILRSAGFELHKWCANSETLISSIPREKREGKYVPSSADNIIKTLGLWWNPDEDSFKFSIELEKKQGFTKRAILSEALRLFDPLGLAGPVIVKAKIFLQQLWSTKIDWDTKLTGEEESQWVSYRDELMNLKNLSIPRLVLSNLTGAMELHGFCDSSERAYGAAIYVKTIENDHDSVVNLLCAKSRVAPLKKTSLPRLELCGALLLAKLAKKVLESITLNFTRFTLWSDSTIVLSWIKSPSSKWKTFVANRVSEIQALTS
ncbi:Hypothetical protein NTJ_11319 [Nesidiocoris tenuis]|nr:Hypothetical protein NTJ_11319 [Nesidiocoris tenuis]